MNQKMTTRLLIGPQNTLPTNLKFLSLDQKVHVVGHQTISIEEEWEFDFLSREQRKELFVVRP